MAAERPGRKPCCVSVARVGRNETSRLFTQIDAILSIVLPTAIGRRFANVGGCFLGIYVNATSRSCGGRRAGSVSGVDIETSLIHDAIVEGVGAAGVR